MTEVQLVPVMIVASALLLYVAERTGLPQTLLLIVCGILIGFLPGVPRFELNPAIVMECLLPPLLYSLTINSSIILLLANWRAAILLGVGLVLATAGVVALVAHSLVPDLSWVTAMLLGLMAAGAGSDELNQAKKRLRVPRRITDKLEAEGRLAPLVLISVFLITLEAGETGSFSWSGAVLKFAADIIGGGLLGAGIGYFAVLLRRRTDGAPIELALSLGTPYLAMLASSVVGVSPILAVISAGFVVAAFYVMRFDPETGETEIAPQTRLTAEAFWSVSGFVLGGILLFLIGLSLPAALESLVSLSFSRLAFYTFALFLIALAVRFVFALVTTWLTIGIKQTPNEPSKEQESEKPADDHSTDGQPAPLKEACLLTWAGTRAALNVVLVLTIPPVTDTGETFPALNLLIAQTCLLTLASLAIQGLTLVPLIRLLGLADSPEEKQEEYRARRTAAAAGLQKLNERFDVEAINEDPDARELTHQLQRQYERQLGMEEPFQTARDDGQNDAARQTANKKAAHQKGDWKANTPPGYARLRAATLDAERLSLFHLRDCDALGVAVFHRLIIEIETEAERLKSGALL